MNCAFCSFVDTQVIDSRVTEDGKAIRRRRSCPSCARRFTTYERVEEMPLWVIKRDGGRQPFDRKKLIAGMLRACEKRPVALSALEHWATQVERSAQEMGDKEVSTHWIGEEVMKALRVVDDVAYVRFASVYRSFRDADEFAQELQRMKDGTAPSTLA